MLFQYLPYCFIVLFYWYRSITQRMLLTCNFNSPYILHRLSSWLWLCLLARGRRSRDRMVVGLTTTCAISTYQYWSCEFKSRTWRGVLDTTLCDKVCQWLPAGRWFSSCIPVSSTNKTDRHEINEIILNVTWNTMNPTLCILLGTVIGY